MRFQMVETVDPVEWNKALCSLGGAIFHSTVWAEYLKGAQPQALPQFMSLSDDGGKPIGMALGLRTRSSHRLMAPFTGRLSLDALPVASADDEASPVEFIRHMEYFARETGNSELLVGSFASARSEKVLGQLGYELTRYFEFVLSLEHSEDELWKGLDAPKRQRVRKAGRMGVSVQELPAEEGLRELRRLQGESSKRIVERGGPDISYKRGRELDPVTVLVDAGVGRLIGARVEGEVVSAGLFTCFNGLVYYTLAGHNRKALDTQAPTMLLWETIKRYRAEGARVFNFGGCASDAVNEGSPEHGLYVYKKAFGGDTITCASGQKVLRKARHRLAGLARRLLRR